jgi:hypothetical protein
VRIGWIRLDWVGFGQSPKIQGPTFNVQRPKFEAGFGKKSVQGCDRMRKEVKAPLVAKRLDGLECGRRGVGF